MSHKLQLVDKQLRLSDYILFRDISCTQFYQLIRSADASLLCVCVRASVCCTTCQPSISRQHVIVTAEMIIMPLSLLTQTLSVLRSTSPPLCCVNSSHLSAGCDQLCHFEGSEIQQGHPDVPPVEGSEAGLRPQLLKQRRRRGLRNCYAQSSRGKKNNLRSEIPQFHLFFPFFL